MKHRFHTPRPYTPVAVTKQTEPALQFDDTIIRWDAPIYDQVKDRPALRNLVLALAAKLYAQRYRVPPGTPMVPGASQQESYVRTRSLGELELEFGALGMETVYRGTRQPYDGPDCNGTYASQWDHHQDPGQVWPTLDPTHNWGLVPKAYGRRIWACCRQREEHPGCWTGDDIVVQPFDVDKRQMGSVWTLDGNDVVRANEFTELLAAYDPTNWQQTRALYSLEAELNRMWCAEAPKRAGMPAKNAGEREWRAWMSRKPPKDVLQEFISAYFTMEPDAFIKAAGALKPEYDKYVREYLALAMADATLYGRLGQVKSGFLTLLKTNDSSALRAEFERVWALHASVVEDEQPAAATESAQDEGMSGFEDARGDEESVVEDEQPAAATESAEDEAMSGFEDGRGEESDVESTPIRTTGMDEDTVVEDDQPAAPIQSFEDATDEEESMEDEQPAAPIRLLYGTDPLTVEEFREQLGAAAFRQRSERIRNMIATTLLQLENLDGKIQYVVDAYRRAYENEDVFIESIENALVVAGGNDKKFRLLASSAESVEEFREQLEAAKLGKSNVVTRVIDRTLRNIAYLSGDITSLLLPIIRMYQNVFASEDEFESMVETTLGPLAERVVNFQKSLSNVPRTKTDFQAWIANQFIPAATALGFTALVRQASELQTLDGAPFDLIAELYESSLISLLPNDEQFELLIDAVLSYNNLVLKGDVDTTNEWMNNMVDDYSGAEEFYERFMNEKNEPVFYGREKQVAAEMLNLITGYKVDEREEALNNLLYEIDLALNMTAESAFSDKVSSAITTSKKLARLYGFIFTMDGVPKWAYKEPEIMRIVLERILETFKTLPERGLGDLNRNLTEAFKKYVRSIIKKARRENDYNVAAVLADDIGDQFLINAVEQMRDDTKTLDVRALYMVRAYIFAHKADKEKTVQEYLDADSRTLSSYEWLMANLTLYRNLILQYVPKEKLEECEAGLKSFKNLKNLDPQTILWDFFKEALENDFKKDFDSDELPFEDTRDILEMLNLVESWYSLERETDNFEWEDFESFSQNIEDYFEYEQGSILDKVVAVARRVKTNDDYRKIARFMREWLTEHVIDENEPMKTALERLDGLQSLLSKERQQPMEMAEVERSKSIIESNCAIPLILYAFFRLPESYMEQKVHAATQMYTKKCSDEELDYVYSTLVDGIESIQQEIIDCKDLKKVFSLQCVPKAIAENTNMESDNLVFDVYTNLKEIFDIPNIAYLKADSTKLKGTDYEVVVVEMVPGTKFPVPMSFRNMTLSVGIAKRMVTTPIVYTRDPASGQWYETEPRSTLLSEGNGEIPDIFTSGRVRVIPRGKKIEMPYELTHVIYTRRGVFHEVAAEKEEANEGAWDEQDPVVYFTETPVSDEKGLLDDLKFLLTARNTKNFNPTVESVGKILKKAAKAAKIDFKNLPPELKGVFSRTGDLKKAPHSNLRTDKGKKNKRQWKTVELSKVAAYFLETLFPMEDDYRIEIAGVMLGLIENLLLALRNHFPDYDWDYITLDHFVHNIAPYVYDFAILLQSVLEAHPHILAQIREIWPYDLQVGINSDDKVLAGFLFKEDENKERKIDILRNSPLVVDYANIEWLANQMILYLKASSGGVGSRVFQEKTVFDLMYKHLYFMARVFLIINKTPSMEDVEPSMLNFDHMLSYPKQQAVTYLQNFIVSTLDWTSQQTMENLQAHLEVIERVDLQTMTHTQLDELYVKPISVHLGRFTNSLSDKPQLTRTLENLKVVGHSTDERVRQVEQMDHETRIKYYHVLSVVAELVDFMGKNDGVVNGHLMQRCLVEWPVQHMK